MAMSTHTPTGFLSEQTHLLKHFPTKELLTWFKHEKRGLPWRDLVSKPAPPKTLEPKKFKSTLITRGRLPNQTSEGPASTHTRDPYAVWILETMLQQTQIKTVLPYYKRWMNRYPTLSTLAQTTEAEALKYFQGLGYYRRLHSLLKTARIITNELAGRFPSNRKELLTLPGIGHYTAGAILTFAFHKREPAVDGNIVRVLSRYFVLPVDKQTLARYPSQAWKLMKELLPSNPRQCSRFNEAMMELGAIVCKAQNPQCTACPLMSTCEAFLREKVHEFPLTSVNPVIQQVYSSLLVITQDKKFLLTKRTRGGRLAGMWGFPIIEHHDTHAKLTDVMRVKLCKTHCKLSLNPASLEVLTTFITHYTRYRAEVMVYRAALNTRIKLSDKNLSAEFAWFSTRELSNLGLASLDGRVRATLLETMAP